MTFDVIVVGAGSAGAVLAARLSEDTERQVLLLDAGPDHRSADTPEAIAGPDFWRACAEPGRVFDDLVATHAPGQEAMPYLRGRGTGGSSAVNAMVALRGLPADYDRWAHELGCRGWAWDDVLPWFLAVEDDREHGGDGRHGAGGPIPLAAGLGVCAMRVFSCGRVTLADAAPRAQPRVAFGMLADRPAVAALTDTVVAGGSPLSVLDDPATLEAWMDATVTNYVHSVGTCRMGDRSDPAAVVDTDCRVLGRDGLRVVDASVMPDIPRANTHLTTVVIAERIADRLRRTTLRKDTS